MTTASTAVLEQPRSERTSSPSTPLLAFAGLMAVAHLPLLIAHGKALWLRDHYQLFPLVLVFAGILARPAIEVARSMPAGPKARRAGMFLLGLNWLLLAAGVIIDSPVLGAFAFWVLLIAVAVSAGGWPTLKAALPALIYLLLIIPPPFNLDGRLVTFLQTYTSKVSSRILDLIPVHHAMNGVVVEVGDKKYEIERACSGISSLLSVLACTLFYVFWVKAHWLRGTILILAAVFWVLINNITRVVAIVYFDSRFEIDLSKDEFPWYAHTMLGVVLFALTLALIASTDRLLLFIGSTVRWGAEKPAFKAPMRPSGVAPFTMSWSSFTPIAVAYGLLILFQIGDYGIGSGSIPESRLIASYNNFNASTLPDDIQGWKRSTGRSAFTTRDDDDLFHLHGAHSRSWRYQRGNVVTQVSFDYPFPFWHDLRVCYTSTGWTIEESSEFNHRVSDGAGDLQCMAVRLSRPVEQNAYLWFGEFDLNGRPVEAKDPGLASYRFVHRIDSLKDRLGRLVGRHVDPEARAFQVLQVQVLAQTQGVLNDTEKNEVQKFFGAVTDIIRGKCQEALRSAQAAR
jgi:exosortase